MKIDEDKLYVVEGIMLGYVQRVMDRLYKYDFQRMTADESRDLANGLHAHLHSHVFEYETGRKV